MYFNITKITKKFTPALLFWQIHFEQVRSGQIRSDLTDYTMSFYSG